MQLFTRILFAVLVAVSLLLAFAGFVSWWFALVPIATVALGYGTVKLLEYAAKKQRKVK